MLTHSLGMGMSLEELILRQVVAEPLPVGNLPQRPGLRGAAGASSNGHCSHRSPMSQNIHS